MDNYDDIMNQCRKGERRAQLEFYMMFHKSVYNSCYRILGNRQEAEEIMQDSFLKVLDKTELLQEDAVDMEKILKRIAINASIDCCRKRKVRWVELEDKHAEIPDEGTEEVLQNEIRLEAIERMMPLLPEGYRVVLSLHLIEGMDYAEIAGQLKVEPSTVRSQFTRAKQRLVHLIEKHYGHENIFGESNQE